MKKSAFPQKSWPSALTLFVLLALLCAGACGGKTVSGISAGQDPREQELKDVLADADPMTRNLLDALNAGDHKAYVRDFEQSDRKEFNPKQFEKLQHRITSRLGLYEGVYQAHKIELYPSGYRIYYFIKFQKTPHKNPAMLIMSLKNPHGRLAITDATFSHALLDAPS